MNEKGRSYIFMLSAIFVLAGALFFITRWEYAPYIFAIGAAGVTVCMMTTPYKNLGFRQRRLHRINVMAGILMVIASAFMFRQKMEWVVFLFIAALLILYTSFFSPHINDKNSSEKNSNIKKT